jgi:predicted ATPase
VTDIADALILKRLFEIMMNQQTVVVMTSNRVPEDLYKGGLQRDVFLPFIPFLKSKQKVIDMDSKIDYRYSDSESCQSRLLTYLQPLDENNKLKII